MTTAKLKLLQKKRPDLIITESKPVKKSVKRVNVPQSMPKGLSYILGTLKLLGVEYVREYLFDNDGKRKFRFDVAIVSKKIAIEYEGIFGDEKSGHTTAKGYIKDCTKYNLAAIQGWRVLRYTGNNYKDFYRDFERLRCN